VIDLDRYLDKYVEILLAATQRAEQAERALAEAERERDRLGAERDELRGESADLRATLAEAQLHITGLLEQREAMEADHELDLTALRATLARAEAEKRGAVEAFDAADTIAIREMRRANQAESDRDRLTAERDALRAEADGLREDVDQLTELVKLDAGTIRLREQEKNSGLREEIERLRKDVDFWQRNSVALRKDEEKLRAALGGAQSKLKTFIPRAQALGHTGVVNVLEDILATLGRPDEDTK
jgi:chromosome segregation ATPase